MMINEKRDLDAFFKIPNIDEEKKQENNCSITLLISMNWYQGYYFLS